ncbi:MAG: extensin family protein [Paracoccus sp. (in: a-proteobacteria)]|uniref:extensin-like domain-containing protein n=1 Tax=Paracoccus sp. TaxID=267 RepID=UPI0039E49506
MALLLITLPALAQEAPPPAPGREAPMDAERPAPRPSPPENTPPENAPPENAPPAKPREEPPPSESAAQPDPDARAMRETLREKDFPYSACLLDLTLLGARYREEPPITDPDQRDCGIARPIRLDAPLPGIEIAGGAVMRCETAWHLAHWLRDFVLPAAALLPGGIRPVAIEPGTTYQCRATVGDATENLSEHAFGNAFDVSALRFSDGSRFQIQPRQGKGDMAEAFQAAIRASACLHFTTVLGPGANAAHDDHLHLDIKPRKNGWRLCQ